MMAWRMYGTMFGLKEGRNVVRVQRASELSDELAYWNIPKRCFLKSCICSDIKHAVHQMRTCKGCYRVLYCNETCQRR